MSNDKAEDNNSDDNEMAAHRPPVANDDEEGNDESDNETGVHDPPIAGAPLPVNLVQHPDNPPGEIPGVEVAKQAEEHGVAMDPEIPGVGEDEADRIPSTAPGAEPPRDARDSGSARSHSTHLETSSSDRP